MCTQEFSYNLGHSSPSNWQHFLKPKQFDELSVQQINQVINILKNDSSLKWYGKDSRGLQVDHGKLCKIEGKWKIRSSDVKY
jgi:hypothetical protein